MFRTSNAVPPDTVVYFVEVLDNVIYYINTSEIPSELSRENFISLHVKRSRALSLLH